MYQIILGAVGAFIKILEITWLTYLIKRLHDRNMMKRYFTYRDEKSDRFWVIETKEDELFTFYGKNKPRATEMGKKTSELCEAGQRNKKLFDTDDECEKEAAKLIAKKLKVGYLEQEEFFISLYNEIKYLHSWTRTSKINEVLAELDKRDKPLVITYGASDWVESLRSTFAYRSQYHNSNLNCEAVKALAYHLPKLEAANDETKESFLILYGFALRSAAIMDDEKLGEFCRGHLPTETNNKYIAFGLAYSSAKWNNGKDIEKYLKTAITNHRDDEDFEKDDFFKPYMEIIKKHADKHW
jgi:predicted DNA-binding WGR domain protein